MARKTARAQGAADARDYRHDAMRKNNPPAGIAGRGTVERLRKQIYEYDAHLPPVLRFDQSGMPDDIPRIIDTALGQALLELRNPRPEDGLEVLEKELQGLLERALGAALKKPELRALVDAVRRADPWQEWAGKREKKRVEVDPVALHIHERVSARAILQVAARQAPQRSLFADPEQSYREAVQFYQHDVGWANRLILGDSLAVMSSLAVRENLAGKVQMIYIDPPYGIRFSSNFQPVVGERDVKDKDSDLTREPEVVKAFRDTWELGVHTYLSYLRDRLRVAHGLLAETGSVFVQIGDENVHRVRLVLDEVFGPANCMAEIVVQKTGGLGTSGLKTVVDYILWYAKDKPRCKYRQLHLGKQVGIGQGSGERYDQAEFPDGARRPLSRQEKDDPALIPRVARPFQLTRLSSDEYRPNTTVEYRFQGRAYLPGVSAHWKTTPEGLDRLNGSNRIQSTGKTIRYVRFIDDFPAYEITNIWTDVGGSPQKVYVVQTSPAVIQRCLLMTTDPGDLVIDPTCGSGTTAYVAEQWGRRWIAIDSSRVALFVARQRMLTATYDFFRLCDPSRGVGGGFVNKTVPHVTLGGIAQNKALDPIIEAHAPVLGACLAALNAALGTVTPDVRQALEHKLLVKSRARDPDDPVTDADTRRWKLPKDRWQEWEVPFDTDPDWPQPLQDALVAFRTAWRAKMDEVKACIDRSGDQEVLVDQPEIDRKILRVSGPFTVEGVEPAAQTLDEPSPIEAPEGSLPLFAADGGPEICTEAVNLEAYVEKMLRLLRSDGVRFMDNKQVQFESLERRNGGVLHGEGEWVLGEGEPRRVAICIGPQYGPVTARAVDQAIHAAARAGFDDLVMAGFAFDAEATGRIEDDLDPVVRTHLAHIRPDVQMEDLLKDSPASQIFTVFGSPRSRIEAVGGGEYVAHMEGMDVYDPLSNALIPTGADKVAAWFLDIDYDGRTFCVSQAFFPDRSAWAKLARALKGTVEEGAFEQFSGKESMRFTPGPSRRVAVKVIDPRGNEVMRVHDLPVAG
ncbi:MAG: site-specific DNA-methyltransferase [Pseudomonadota bacterium]